MPLEKVREYKQNIVPSSCAFSRLPQNDTLNTSVCTCKNCAFFGGEVKGAYTRQYGLLGHALF